MIVLVQREPRPDASYWPGRRLLAAVDAVDAVIWPVAIVVLARQVLSLAGPFGAVAVTRLGSTCSFR